MVDLLEKTERAANTWPTFKYGALTPPQREVVSWLAFNSRKPTKIKGNVLCALIRRGFVRVAESEKFNLELTEQGWEYARRMR